MICVRHERGQLEYTVEFGSFHKGSWKPCHPVPPRTMTLIDTPARTGTTVDEDGKFVPVEFAAAEPHYSDFMRSANVSGPDAIASLNACCEQHFLSVVKVAATASPIVPPTPDSEGTT